MKKTKIKDPFLKREQEKYENPIASRECIIQLLKKCAKPLSQAQIEDFLELQTEEQQEALRRRLRAMERDGQIIRNRRKGYALVDQMNLIRGRVLGHRDGFGFVVPEDGSEDLFLQPRQMRRVLHGDRVLVHVTGIDHRNRREAAIVEVLEHNTTQIVGRFYTEAGVQFIEPTNQRISQTVLIAQGHDMGAQPGQIVVATLISQPTERQQPIGHVTEILGDQMAPGMEIDVAVRAHNIPFEWPEAVLQEAEQFKPTVDPKACEKRTDLRALPLVTIDGEDAKDFDDAVYCEKNGRQGWRLIVAIADVSHYVKVGSALDQEAERRGNSVYFPGYVIPMLPEALSNGLCSLNPKVDRLCMVCDAVLDRKGKIKKFEFYEAVIRSHARLTYTQVAGMLVDKNTALRKQYSDVLPHLENLYGLYHLLHASRETRGAIDFETTETRIVFDDARKIEKIVPVVRNDAHKIIEECMLLANVCAAEFLKKQKIPFLYRIHEGPNAEKLKQLRTYFAELGIKVKGGKQPKPGDFADLLEKIKGRPDASLLQTIILRSMSQAVYSPNNGGHFGLAYSAYGHFTSPIRRYPDLLIHRALRHVIHKGKAKSFPYDEAKMQLFGEHCSMTERRADAATYDAMDWLKCEYMLDKLGQEFEGTISSVTAFGIFVQLTAIFVEGLVHITELKDDYYSFDPIRFRLTGSRSGTIYKLGDKVKIQVIRVSMDDRKIDFSLAKGPTHAPKKRKK